MRKILLLRRALQESLLHRVHRTRRRIISRSGEDDRFAGCIEKVQYRTIFGWAYDSAQPDRHVFVRFEINGMDAGIAAASLHRSDIARVRHGFGSAGFEFPVPDTVGDIKTVRAFLLDGELELPAESESIIHQDDNRALPSAWKSGDHFCLPSFFVLGAAKCGTTSLHAYLEQHPEICMSHPKEPFFFEAEFERGPAYYFNRYFSHWKGEQIVGESRHRNLYMPYIPQRLANYNPHARLVVVLRNPVERAVSHWWHWYSRSVEALPLPQALEADLKRIEAGYRFETAHEREVYGSGLQRGGRGCFRTYLDTGYYREQIDRYLALFPREQLRVVLFDDLIRDPRKVVREICEFAGADPATADAIDCRRVNRSDPEMLKHVSPGSLAWLSDHYREHNARLEELLGRSLEQWNRPFEKHAPPEHETVLRARSHAASN
jgi:hypothetical protein